MGAASEAFLQQMGEHLLVLLLKGRDLQLGRIFNLISTSCTRRIGSFYRASSSTFPKKMEGKAKLESAGLKNGDAGCSEWMVLVEAGVQEERWKKVTDKLKDYCIIAPCYVSIPVVLTGFKKPLIYCFCSFLSSSFTLFPSLIFAS